MNSFLLSALCLLGVCAALAGGVTVQDGEFSFPLESVKKLKGLQAVQEPSTWDHKKLDSLVVPRLCANPKFPEELQAVCKEPDAEQILHRLVAIAEEPSTCEICAFAACAGC
ncbi:guanylin [Sorex araneus]|uniref:guanylin n=1 Tax=Sorex araneus TaxID=42254 RepID=UPI0003319502|nr:guanylin [Sorex araneus]